MSNVLKICFTGAPCSGKTTIIEHLSKYYTNKGYKVVTVKESATELLLNGANRDNMLDFQDKVLSLQLEQEQRAFLNADDNTIILCDRGIPDGFSYLSNTQAEQLLNKYNLNLLSVWSRYDAVFFLQTTALNGSYVCNELRLENAKDAIINHNNLLKQWVGHPHFRYFTATNNIDEKINNIIANINSLLNNIEYEKKYLIAYPNMSKIFNYPYHIADIEQIYLLSDVGSHRIRKRGSDNNYTYYETLKVRITNDKCYEYENIITQGEYNNLKLKADPNKHPIIKMRCCFLYGGKYFELDLFPFWSDKALLELELVSDDETFTLPPEIEVIKDVSNDKKYKNNYLASVNFNENS